MITLDRSTSIKKLLIVFVGLYSIAAIPVLAGSRADQILNALTAVPVFVYNREFTTVSIKQEQFNYFSATRLVSVLFVAFVFFCVTQRRLRKVRLKLIDVLLFSFFAYRIISEVVLSRNVNLSLMSYMLIAMVLYRLLIGHIDQDIRLSLYKTFAAMGVANALVIVWQAFAIGTNVGSFVLRDFSNQPRGMLMDAVVASIYMTVSLIVILEEVFPVSVAKKIICILLLIAGCVLTGSRGFVILWFVYGLLRLRSLFGSFKRMVALVVSMSVLAIAVFSVFGNELQNVADNFQTLVKFEGDPSSMARKDKIESSIELFRDNPIFGIGSNNFQAITRPEGVSDETLTENPHNVYAQIAAENGLIGVILASWMAFIVIFNRRNVESSLRAILLIVSIGIGYIGALGSLPLVVMLVALLAMYRSDIHGAARPVVACELRHSWSR